MSTAKGRAETSDYFPPSEAKGGWRWLSEDDDIRKIGGFDPGKLGVCFRVQEAVNGGDSWSIVVVRHGWLVGEQSTFNVGVQTKFDTWSVTKSVSALAWGSCRGLREGAVAEWREGDSGYACLRLH